MKKGMTIKVQPKQHYERGMDKEELHNYLNMLRSGKGKTKSKKDVLYNKKHRKRFEY